MTEQKGTVLIEMVVLGFAVLALVVPVLLMVGSLSHAKTTTQTIAADTAWWFARHGSVREMPDGYDVELTTDGSRVTVEVTALVPVVALIDSGPVVSITSVASAVISPYRSAHG
ncbi:MAG: hypothetical protein ACR2N9_03860 [Acidimicrobiia bacterium]